MEPEEHAVVNCEVEETRWKSLPPCICNALLHYCPISTLRLVSPQWRDEMDQTVTNVTFQASKMMRLDVDLLGGIQVLASRFPNLNKLSCVGCSTMNVDWVKEIGDQFGTKLVFLGMFGDLSTQRFEHMPQLMGLRSLYVVNDLGLDEEDVQSFSCLTNLTSLNLKGAKVGDGGITFVSGLTDLRSLNLGCTKVQNADVLLPLTKLTELELWGTELGEDPKTLEVLSHLKRLARLDLGHTKVQTIEGFVSELTHLTRLKLSGTPISDDALQHLFTLPSLKELHLDMCKRISREKFLDVRALTNLNALYLDQTAVSDPVMETLIPLPHLTTLGLSYTSIGDKGVEHLSHIPSLTSICLNFTRITDEAVRYLVNLPDLRCLYVTYAGITKDGFKHIGRMSKLEELFACYLRVSDEIGPDVARLTNLERLEMANTGVTNDFVPSLMNLKKLERLSLVRTRLTDSGAKLLKNLPKLKAVSLKFSKVSLLCQRDINNSLNAS